MSFLQATPAFCNKLTLTMTKRFKCELHVGDCPSWTQCYPNHLANVLHTKKWPWNCLYHVCTMFISRSYHIFNFKNSKAGTSTNLFIGFSYLCIFTVHSITLYISFGFAKLLTKLLVTYAFVYFVFYLVFDFHSCMLCWMYLSKILLTCFAGWAIDCMLD